MKLTNYSSAVSPDDSHFPPYKAFSDVNGYLTHFNLLGELNGVKQNGLISIQQRNTLAC